MSAQEGGAALKILHTSDLHFGISLRGVSLLEYQKKFCESLCDIVREHGIDAVIAAGDIFDTSVATSEAVKCWSRFATRLCLKMNIPLIVCAGNHDGSARLASCSDILRESDLYISGTLADAFIPIRLGDCEIYSLPYFNAADAATQLECDSDSASVMKAICQKILSSADKDRKLILAAHCFAAGGKVSESDISARTAESVGGADLIPSSAFDGFDYVALGHLHRPQTISRNGTIVRYSGTPLPYSFGEADQHKTVTVYDTSDGSFSEIEVPQPYTLRNIEGSYADIVCSAQNDPNRTDFVKIRLTDSFGGENMYVRLKELYPNLLQFSGCTYSSSDTSDKITADEAELLDPVSLAMHYSKEIRSKELDSDELNWLAEAVAEVDRESV